MLPSRFAPWITLRASARRLSRSFVPSLLLVAFPGRALAAEPADKIDETVAEFFRPFQNDLATLAPDGRHLAMSETTRNRETAIVVINLDDRTTQRYAVGGADHAVLQLLWVSPTRLIFTTRSRAVAAIELGLPEVRPLLLGRTLDAYQPDPILGPRSNSAVVTADMPAGGSTLDPSFGMRQEISVKEALQEHARVTGDLFGAEAKGDTGRAIRPFLLGLKPGSPTTVLVEVRGDGDLHAYTRLNRRQVTVPGNVYIVDRTTGPPIDPAEQSGGGARSSNYASYNIDFVPPPLVVLELDTKTGRTRDVANEPDWRRVWLDQQGQPRLALEDHGRDLRYLYRAANKKKWVPLDSLTKAPSPLGFTVNAENLLGARSVPLGFNADGRTLFVATNVGRDTFSLRALDLEQGQLVEAIEVTHDRYDLIEPTSLIASDVLRFDPRTHQLAGVRFASALHRTHWIDPAIAALQADLGKQLAPKRCEIREWNAERTRFLLEAAGPGEPGGFYVVDAAAGKIIHCGDRAPWLTDTRRNATREFDFLTDDGRRLAGCLTLPRQPRLNPPPVLVYFHDGPWYSDSLEFNRGAQALAELGFAVLQLNHRGSSGYGRTHLTAIAGGLDRAALDDVRALLTRFQGLPINTRMVAALGNGIGGYLAVRMAQLAPETFRCAVAINTPGDLAAWRAYLEPSPTLVTVQRLKFFGTEPELLRTQSALAAAATTKAPVLVVHASEDSYVPVSMGHQLYRALKAGAEETAFLELPGEGHGGWSEKTTARLFAELGRFFNSTIYNYRVDLRPPEVVR